MTSVQKERSLNFITIAIVFVIGAGASAGVFYGFSFIDRSTDRVESTTTHSGVSSSEQNTSLGESEHTEAFSENPTRIPFLKLEEIVQLDGPLERNTVLHSVLTQADEAQVLDMLETSKDLDPTAHIQTQTTIVQRLVRINPSSALVQVEQFDRLRAHQLLIALFSEWAQIDLDEAVARAANLTGEGRGAALAGILRERIDLTNSTRREIAQRLHDEQYAINLIIQEKISDSIDEPEKVWRESVKEAKHDPKLAKMLKEIALNWVEKDGLEAFDQIIESLDNSLTRSLISTSVLREVARTDPNGALGFAMTLDYDPFHETKYAVVDEWVESDLQSAYDSISSMEQTGRKRILMKRLIQTWGSYQPENLLANLESLPSELIGFATERVVSRIASGRPDEAAKVVSTLNDDSSKIDAAQKVIQLWSMRNTDAMLDWVLNDPGLKVQRTRLLSYVLVRLVPTDVKRAMDVALAHPIDENEPGLEATVVGKLASTNMGQALEFLPRVREGPTKTETYCLIGLELIKKNRTEEALSLVRQMPDYARANYLNRTFGSWALSNPKSLLESLDHMPSAEIASTAAVALLQSQNPGEELSADQLNTARGYLTQEDATRFGD